MVRLWWFDEIMKRTLQWQWCGGGGGARRDSDLIVLCKIFLHLHEVKYLPKINYVFKLSIEVVSVNRFHSSPDTEKCKYINSCKILYEKQMHSANKDHMITCFYP